MKTWYRLAIPLFVSSLAYACTITTGGGADDWDEIEDPPAGSGNRAGSGTAGSRAGSSNTAGTGGTSAGSGGTGTAGAPVSGGTAGTAGTGGEDFTDLVCPTDELQGTPAPSTEFEESEDDRYAECVSCLQTSCDSELKQCYASDPHDPCGWGVTDRDGLNELFCYVECLVSLYDEFNDPEDDRYTCATECGSQYDGMGNACNPLAFSQSTQDLTQCLHKDDQCDAFCIDAVANK